MTKSFRHFARGLFSRHSASAKFHENETPAKINEFTVSRPPIQLIHRLYQLDLTFCLLILRAMLFDGTLIELFDFDIGL